MTEETFGGSTPPPTEPESTPEVSPAEELDTLRRQLEEERAKSAETYDQYLRSVAELRNYKKRIEQDRELLAREASAVLIARLLPVLDDLDRAMAILPDEQLRHLSWVEGIALIYRRFQAVMEQAGLRPIEALGQPFDPRFHEAILYEEGPAEKDGIVLGDLQKGYRLYDRILRPTLVKVGKALTPSPQAAEETGVPGEE